MKKFILDFFKIDYRNSSSIDADEQIRKTVMLYSIVVLGIVLLVTMGAILCSEGNYFYAVLNFIVSVIILGLILLLRSGVCLKICSIISVLLVQLFFMFLFHSGAGNQMAFVWYYLFPLVSLFLLGTKSGSLFSLLMIVLSIAINSLAGQYPLIVAFPAPMMYRIVISYLGVLLFAFVFEKTRMSTHAKLKISMGEVNELAIRDGLTGLHNRRYMDIVVNRITRQFNHSGSSVGFIMVDLDHFKNYNDSYGHQAGDKLLCQLSEMFASILHRKSDYIFRYGGEEFAFLLPSTTLHTAESFAEKIVENTRSLNIPHPSNQAGRVTVSAGVSFIDFDHGKSIEELVKTADNALYEAKNLGRNRFVVKIIQ